MTRVKTVARFRMMTRYGKKIWLTEFAKCCTKDESEVIDFMKVRHEVLRHRRN